MNDTGREIWTAVSEAFGRLRGRAAQQTWLAQARPASFRRGLFTLDVATAAAKTAIDARYRADLESLFREFTGSTVRVQTRVADVAEATIGKTAARPRIEPLPTAPSSFAVTGANKLAHGAVQRFQLSTQAEFNPLFIYGPAGTGKTELARFALDGLMRSGDVTDPLVLSGEALARDVARAVRASEMPKLMAEWAQRDMVLLDEAHRLRGQRRAQAETVNLMHSVLQRGGRVLVLSRHPPQEIHGLDERLSSHLLAGMLVRLGEPDPSDRCAVLEAVGAGVAVPIEPGVAAALAQRCPGTLTDAVTLLGRLAAEAAASGGKLTLAETVARLARAQPGGAGMDALLTQVARATGVPITRIRSSDKSREVARARHVVVYLATNSLGMSARQICRHLGLRSPSVAAYARRQVDRRRRLDSGFDQIVLGLQAHLDGAQRDLAW